MTSSERREAKRALRRRALIITALATLASACSGTAASEAPPTTATSTTAATPVAATAQLTEAGLSAPHSGDRPVAAGCPTGGEMLDWDGDGWGDCVDTGVPAQAPRPAPGG